MQPTRTSELVFLYVIVVAVAYVLWLIFSPYFVALTLAGMLVLGAYPVHNWLTKKIFRQSPTLAALVSTFLTYIFIVIPIFLVLLLLTKETVLFYESWQGSTTTTYDNLAVILQTKLSQYLPKVTISIATVIKYIAAWGASHLQVIFSSAVSFVVSLLVSIMATFFFFRDGKKLITWLIEISPLPDSQDQLIINKITTAVRSVLTGIIFVSLLQGLVAGLGFLIFGVPKPVLWGTVAGLGGLLPGIGTPVIMIPAVIYLYLTDSTFMSLGLILWALLSIVIVDNIIAPILMSRGNPLHPLLVLLSILGGISLMGMLGIVVGPVVVSVFLVLLDLQKNITTNERVAPEISKPKNLRNK